jgi:type IV secretory pathway ATPase VirB11/archaellum biosynthesis ATPase
MEGGHGWKASADAFILHFTFGFQAVRRENVAVCDYEYDEERMKLRINCVGCLYGSSIEDYEECMARTIDKILEIKKVASIVLAKNREYEYDYEQTKMLVEIAKVLEETIRGRLLSKKNLGPAGCEKCLPGRMSRLHYIVIELLRRDPIGAYVELVREIRLVNVKLRKPENRKCYACLVHYRDRVLEVLRDKLEATQMIRLAKPYTAGYHIGDRALYRQIFSPSVRPNFMLTRYMITPPEGGRSVDRYKVGDTQVEIFKVPGQTGFFYYAVPPEFRLSEDRYSVLDAARKYMAAHRPKSVEFVKSRNIRDIFYSIGKDMIREMGDSMGVSLTLSDIEQISNILTRYTAGLGVLEILLADERIQDIYVNSPVENQPIMIYHQDWEECKTNLIPSTEDAEAWATRLRIHSGRPLDEANPVLDTDVNVPGGNARFCVITRTLSPHGIGFAIRRHRDKPWTLPLFVKSKMLSPLAAGLLSFLIDGAVSILVAGGRGAGKTSILGSLMLELLPKVRVVSIEDTLELPIEQMKELHYNIERLKSRSVITRVETEMPADEALRTALRLGDSALVVGEVRSSIRGNEEVVIFDNGIMKRVRIKDLENKDLSKVYVPTVGFDLKVNFTKLTDFVKHPKRERLIRIKTKTGREVTVTHDHSLFAPTKNFEIAPIECKNLKVGSHVVIPSRMPCGFNDIDTINVFDYLPEFRVQNFEEDVRKAIKALGWKKATEICNIKTGDVYNYFRTNQRTNIPLQSFNKLMEAADLNYGPARLEAKRGTSLPLPAAIPVNEDFCRFLGYYVSEGYHSLGKSGGGSVVITNSNPEIIEDLSHISQSLFNLTPDRRVVKSLGTSVQHRLNCLPLAKLISELGCGRTCTEKRVPPIIFGLSKHKIAAFLCGLYSGDGSFTSSKRSGNSIRYSSTSKKLVEDISYLLLNFGIVSTIREYPPKGIGKHAQWALTFKDRKMVETFLNEIGIKGRKIKPVIRKWPHTVSNSVKFDKEMLGKHLIKYSRRYRHLFRFLACSKNYLEKVVQDPECKVSERLKTFALGEFFLDEVKEIEEITLEEPEYVYDLSVAPTENFIGGFGGILLHNTEAKALYEAMRIGALSNVVAGTIHGESAYGVYDRVVNDLGVPPTSFKATDIIPICKSLRSADGMHRFRRMTEITEVRKEWDANPAKEGGFVNLMEYSGKEDVLKPTETLVNGESEIVNRIASYVKEWSGNWSAVWENIQLRARIKQSMVDMAEKTKNPNLLEAEWVVRSNQQFHLLQEELRVQTGAAEANDVYNAWLKWYKAATLKKA